MAKENLSTQIFNTLKQRIIKWEYLPGQRLIEETLCQEFGVSRIPVREALRMLEDNRLVEKVRHRGCTVKQPNLSEINHLYDVRLALELFVGEQLATYGLPSETWQSLYDSWHGLQQRQDGDETIDTFQLACQDEAFHETLASATGNETMLDMLHMINERLRFVRLADITTSKLLQATCEQHLYILDCIKARDVPATRGALQANIEFGRNNVEIALKDALAQAYMNQQTH